MSLSKKLSPIRPLSKLTNQATGDLASGKQSGGAQKGGGGGKGGGGATGGSGTPYVQPAAPQPKKWDNPAYTKPYDPEPEE